MLTAEQENFLNKMPPEQANQLVSILPYNPLAKEVGSHILSEIKRMLPKVMVFFHGSAALGIAGMDDVDIAAISSGDFDTEKKSLTDLFGEPRKIFGGKYTLWEFKKEGFKIEITLNDNLSGPIKEQLDTFEKLKANKDLLTKYEKIKLDMNGKAYKDYQTAKYEFLNSI